MVGGQFGNTGLPALLVLWLFEACFVQIRGVWGNVYLGGLFVEECYHDYRSSRDVTWFLSRWVESSYSNDKLYVRNADWIFCGGDGLLGKENKVSCDVLVEIILPACQNAIFSQKTSKNAGLDSNERWLVVGSNRSIAASSSNRNILAPIKALLLNLIIRWGSNSSNPTSTAFSKSI